MRLLKYANKRFQILNHKPYEKMLNVLDKLLRSLDYKFEFIDLGGGMGINYDNKTKKLNYTKYKKNMPPP